MGAYRYCLNCDAPLGKPTIREDLSGKQFCSCGAEIKPAMSLREWIIEIHDRLAELEARIEKEEQE
jgi:hypothetical protein